MLGLMLEAISPVDPKWIHEFIIEPFAGTGELQSGVGSPNTTEKGGLREAGQTESYAGYTCERVYYQTPR